MRLRRDPSVVLLVASAAAAGFLWRAALEPDRLPPALLAPPANTTDAVSTLPDAVARLTAPTGGPSRAGARPPAVRPRGTAVPRAQERAEQRSAARATRTRAERTRPPRPTPTSSPAPKPQQPSPTSPAPKPDAPAPKPTAPAPKPTPPPPKPTPPAPKPEPPAPAPPPEPAAAPAPAPTTAAAPAPAPASEPTTESDRPGWGKGDRNHDHSGPPGKP